MPTLSLSEVVENVATSYDLDGDGVLKWEELVRFFLGFLRKYGPGSVGFWHDLTQNKERRNKYSITDVEMSKDPFAGGGCSMPLAGVVEFVLDQNVGCSDVVRAGALSHGYKPERDGWIRTPEADEVRGTWSFVYKLASIHDQETSYDSWEMEVGNAMHTFKALPSEECLCAIERSGRDARRGMWEERRAKWRMQRVSAMVRSLPTKERQTRLTKAMQRVFARFDSDEDDFLNERECLALVVCTASDAYETPRTEAIRMFGSLPVSKDCFLAVVEDESKYETIMKFLLSLEFDDDLICNFAQNDKTTLSSLLASWKNLCEAAEFDSGRCIHAFQGVCALLDDVFDDPGILLLEDVENIEFITRMRGLLDYWKLRQQITADQPSFLKAAQGDVEIGWKAVNLLIRIHLGLSESSRRNRTDDAPDSILEAIDEAASAHANTIVERLCQMVQVTFPDPADLLSKLRGRTYGGRDKRCFEYLSEFGFERKGKGEGEDHKIDKQPLMYRTLGKAKLRTVALLLARASACCHWTEQSKFAYSLGVVLERMSKELNVTLLEMATKLGEGDFGGLPPQAWLMIASLKQKRLPPTVLPSDSDIVAGGPDCVVSALCAHLGIKVRMRETLNRWFCGTGFIGKEEDFGEVVHRDALFLLRQGISRDKIAEQMENVLALGLVAEGKEFEEMMEGKWLSREDMTQRKKKLEEKAHDVAKTLNLDAGAVLMASVEVPWAVHLCRTMGHHEDAFYPFGAMQSYYLGTGGSCDCVIINKNLSVRGDGMAMKVASWKELLVQRLNATKRPQWEDWDGVLYLSDMQPYLIRQGLFQGKKSRYRVDPERALKVLGLD